MSDEHDTHKPAASTATMAIDRELHRELKVTAARRGISLKELVEPALRALIQAANLAAAA